MKVARAACKDSLLVTAQSDKMIYNIYTYEEQEVSSGKANVCEK